MTQEEKAKAYDEALERAEGIIKYYKECNRDEASIEDLETIFPELAESEDERIRKALVRFHKSTIDIDGIKGEQILAWLEKQGEQKLANSAKTCKKSQRMVSAKAKEALYDKPAWSEEEEVKINRIVAYLENLNVADNDILLKDVDWLKSLKDRKENKL